MSTLTGTGGLIRLILRRDRVRLPVWFGLVAMLVIGVAGSVAGAYPTEVARQAFLHDQRRPDAAHDDRPHL